MNIRLAYAIPMTLFALVTAFYAIMTLAFFFGERHYAEWVFPVIVTAAAGIMVWAAAALWWKKQAIVPTAISLLLVLASSWLIIAPSSTDPLYFVLVALIIIALGLLIALAFPAVRDALRA